MRTRGTSLIGISVRDFFRTKGFIRIFDGFFLKTKGFYPRCTRFLGVKCPSMRKYCIRLTTAPSDENVLMGFVQSDRSSFSAFVDHC